MTGWKIFYYIDLALMFPLAFLLYDWNGIFVVEGVLLGAGLAVANVIWNKRAK